MSHVKEVDYIATGHYARLRYDTNLQSTIFIYRFLTFFLFIN